MPAEYTPKYFNEVASGLSGRFGFKDRMLFNLRPYICPFHVLISFVRQGCDILDIGCGRGLWLYLLMKANRIHQGMGIDVSESLIESARSIRPDNFNLYFSVIKPDQNLPEGDFDCVSMIDVLHHVPVESQEKFIKNISSTKTKRIIFKDIDPDAKIKSRFNTLHDVVVSGQVPKYCRPELVKQWLIESGFEITAGDRADMLWYSHYYIVADR